MVSLADSVTRLTVEVGVQTVVRGQSACGLDPLQTCNCILAASVVQCQKLANRISHQSNLQLQGRPDEAVVSPAL